ncbi:MAG: ribonuclease P protein component [Pseudohongiellaceae bacterium]
MPEAGFPQKLRLSNAAEFNAVFSNVEYKSSSRQLVMFALGNRLSYPRLGLVVGKKNVPLAVDRNRVKRILRASFRQNQQLLVGLDIVILARNELGAVTNKWLHDTSMRMWQDLCNKHARKPTQLTVPAVSKQ